MNDPLDFSHANTDEEIDPVIIPIKNRWPFECTKCKLKFERETHLNTHYFSVHKESKFLSVRSSRNRSKSYECKPCNSSYNTKWDLKLHSSSVHKYECKICRAVEKTKMDLQAHISSFHNNQKSHLSMYRLSVHEEKKVFHCQSCGKKFSQESNLKRHNSIVHA